MRKIIIIVSLILVAVATISSGTKAADPLKPLSLEYSTGKVVQENSSDLYFASISPGFGFGNFGFSLDFNFYVDNEFRMRDGGNDAIVLGSLDYIKKDRFKLHYGDIENLTFGSGFIVSNYRLNTKGNIPLNRQKGAEIDIQSPAATIKVFATRTKLVGVRAVRDMKTFLIGTTVISDTDPDFEIYAIDAQKPLTEKTSIYGEVASISDYGDGFALGVMSSPFSFMDIKFELRDYDSDFIPGIVDEHYEVSSPIARLTGNPAGRMLGYFTSMNLFHGSNYWGTFTYEDYETYKPKKTILGGAKFSDRLKADLFYATQNGILQRNNPKSEDSVVRARLYFQATKKMELVLDYYNAFEDDGSRMESLTAKANFKLW